MWCTCWPLYAPCAPPSAGCRVLGPRPLLPLCASRAALVAAHARPACVPCSPLLYPCPATLTPLSLPRPLSSGHNLTVSQPCVTRRGVACPSPSGYYRLLSPPVLYTLPSSPLAGTTYAADAPTATATAGAPSPHAPVNSPGHLPQNSMAKDNFSSSCSGVAVEAWVLAYGPVSRVVYSGGTIHEGGGISLWSGHFQSDSDSFNWVAGLAETS